MRKSGPNWGLAFGSGSFLLVLSLGLLTGVDPAAVAIRASLATFLGAGVGLLVEKTANGLEAVRSQSTKGHRLDFTVSAAADEMDTGFKERLVPAAGAPAASDFEPIDFKKAARQVQGMLND